MASLLFALVGGFLTTLGARDQMLVAGLRARLGPSRALALVALGCALVSALLAAWLGALIAERLSASTAPMLVALALLFAAVDLFWPRQGKALAEPTRSLGAVAIALLVHQLTDTPRFLIFALAAATASPALAGLGGAIGSGAALIMGWSMGESLASSLPLRALRLTLGAIIAVIAVIVGLSARGIIGG